MKRGLTLSAVCLVTLALLAGSGRAQPKPIDTVEYLRRLATASAIARSSAIRPSPARMDEVRRTLGLPLTVVIRDRKVHVPSDRFLDELRGEHGEDFIRAANHLDGVEESTQRAIVRSIPKAGRVDAALDKAYSGISFSETPLQRARQAIVDFLSEQLARFIFYLGNNRGAGTLFAWGVVLAVVGLAALFVIKRVRLVPDKAVEESGRQRADRVDWEAEAAAALARGDHVGAVRARYRALLQALSYRGAIDDAPSLTAGEARGATGKTLPKAYPAVAGATEVFERVAYGRSPLAPGDLEAMKEAESVVRVA